MWRYTVTVALHQVSSIAGSSGGCRGAVPPITPHPVTNGWMTPPRDAVEILPLGRHKHGHLLARSLVRNLDGLCSEGLGLEKPLEFLLGGQEAFIEGLPKESFPDARGEEDIEEGVAPPLTPVTYSLGGGGKGQRRVSANFTSIMV